MQFTKMHGLGNSYIYVDGWKNALQEENLSALAIAVSCPATGIGSDGLILMGPSRSADIKMRIFNKDGSEAKNCGNGLRCVAKYAFEHGLVKNKSMKIETLGGIVEATVIEHEGSRASVLVNMGAPRLARSAIPMRGPQSENVINEPFEIEGQILRLTAVSMGNPHAVFFVNEAQHVLHHTLGPKIETDPRFPERINVEFVYVESARSLHMRVWERGSGVTQACGTGACAVVVAAVLNGLSKKDEEVTVHLEGGDLKIVWRNDGNVWMQGPAETIASGRLA